jgi:hypothetical protein
MTYVQRNEEIIDLEEIGIRTKDFIVMAPTYEHTTEPVEGMDGVIDLGSAMAPRNIRCLFKFASKDWIDFAKIRDDVFSLFDSKESFYLIDRRQPGKRWKVKTSEEYQIPQTGLYGDFEVMFTAFSGTSESIGTTTQASTFESLDLPVNYMDYQDIRATRFRVYNAGKEIDPRSIHNLLRITYKGESEDLRIENLTTGDVWQYLGTTLPEDEIVLEGIRSTKNSLSIFRDTNKRLITLASGWNDFEISGADAARRYAVQAHMPRKEMPDELRANPITFEFKYRW